MKKCPFCAEEIQDNAIKCKHCGEFLIEKRKLIKKCPHCGTENEVGAFRCKNEDCASTFSMADGEDVASKKKKNIRWGSVAIIIFLMLIGIIYINTTFENAQKNSIARKNKQGTPEDRFTKADLDALRAELAGTEKTNDKKILEENKKNTVNIYNGKNNKLGVSYDGVMQYLTSFFPKMERGTLNDGRLRYMGQANKTEALATLEIIGDKNNIDTATLILFIPNDAPNIIIGNSAIMIRFLMNLFPSRHKDVSDWVNKRFDSFQSNPRTFKEEKIFDGKKIEWSIIKEFAMITISVGKQ